MGGQTSRNMLCTIPTIILQQTALFRKAKQLSPDGEKQ
jgi:hypothetical protein